VAAGPGLAEARHVLDAYGGVGLFTAALAGSAPTAHWTMVESNPSAVADARVNLADLPATIVGTDMATWVPEPVDLVTIDMAWTPQRLAIPAALRWLSTAPHARIITLVKPHYEVTQDEKRLLKGGALEPDDSRAVCARVLATMPSLGVRVIAHADSPITGGKTSKKGRGNMEFLALLARAE
jgi:predicted rRNA methylase YqxC with S4 and FtsJ domains